MKSDNAAKKGNKKLTAARFGFIQKKAKTLSSNWLGQHPLKVSTRVRVPLGSPNLSAGVPPADFLIDGGATASYFYGPLKP